MTGHTSRRYEGTKRTFRNQDLGPFIGHEMNRCITCYRCVRYYQDYAGGRDLQAFGSRSRMFFGRESDGVLESEFAGNLVEVCPTGVFTDKPFSATYTRKWDLQSAPSVCPGCAVGCNTLPGERYGSLEAGAQPLPPRCQRLLPLRSGPVRQPLRQQSKPSASSRRQGRGRHFRAVGACRRR